MKAFILCAGLGTRLRPFTHSQPKATMPFLNLPLLSWSWFYLEQMGMSEAWLNSHLFPAQLESAVQFLKSPEQKSSIAFEETSLDSAGGLFNIKKHLEGTDVFAYMNGDSLFFPSELNQLKKFKQDFLSSSLEASLFGVPETKQDQVSLWVDQDFILRGIGLEKEMLKRGFHVKRSPDLKLKEVRPIQFSGLALFKNSFLKSLTRAPAHIFYDVMIPSLEKSHYKVFVDEEGLILEGGETNSYLEATELCLHQLFASEISNQKNFKLTPKMQNSISKILQQIFTRFDAQDKKVGFQSGQALTKKFQVPLLLPSSVKNLKYLKPEGFVVLGEEVQLHGPSHLKNVILGREVSWRGSLSSQILIKSLY